MKMAASVSARTFPENVCWEGGRLGLNAAVGDVRTAAPIGAADRPSAPWTLTMIEGRMGGVSIGVRDCGAWFLEFRYIFWQLSGNLEGGFP